MKFLLQALDTKEGREAAVFGLYMSAEISEGAACQTLRLDRVDFREQFQQWFAEAENRPMDVMTVNTRKVPARPQPQAENIVAP